MAGKTSLTLARALLVWFGAIALATASIEAAPDRTLVSGLLIFFYTLPALLFFVLLQLAEDALLRSDGAPLALGIGPALAVFPYLSPGSGFVGELLGPAGICWLGTALLRLAFSLRSAARR